MLDQQDADASFGDDPAQQVAEPTGLVMVQPGRRLVEQQHVERAGQAAGQLDEPPLTGGQRAGLPVREIGDAAQLERGPRGGLGVTPLGAVRGELFQGICARLVCTPGRGRRCP